MTDVSGCDNTSTNTNLYLWSKTLFIVIKKIIHVLIFIFLICAYILGSCDIENNNDMNYFILSKIIAVILMACSILLYSILNWFEDKY